MTDLSRRDDLNRAVVLMHFAFRKMIEEPDRLLARRGFGRVHHRILFFVGRRPGLSVGELLGILDVTKQSLHRPKQELVRTGLLDARPDPKNRRIKRLELTSRGAAYEDKLSGMQRALFARVFSSHGRAAERAWRDLTDDLGERRAAVAFSPQGHARGSSPKQSGTGR